MKHDEPSFSFPAILCQYKYFAHLISIDRTGLRVKYILYALYSAHVKRDATFESESNFCLSILTRGINILDFVLSTFPDLVQKNDVEGGMSDHSVVITDLNLKVKPPRKAKGKFMSTGKQIMRNLKMKLEQHGLNSKLVTLTTNLSSKIGTSLQEQYYWLSRTMSPLKQ